MLGISFHAELKLNRNEQAIQLKENTTFDHASLGKIQSGEISSRQI